MSFDDIPIDRRTALKMTGGGIAGSMLFSGSAAARADFDAAVTLLNAHFEDVEIEDFLNIINTESDFSGASLEIHGSVLFNKKAGADAFGGGPFSVDGTEGTWTADSVVRFEKYGHFPSSFGAPWPKAWNGGLVELEVDFPDGTPPGIRPDDTLLIECWIGTNDSDVPQQSSQGVFIGDYQHVEAFGTVFNY